MKCAFDALPQEMVREVMLWLGGTDVVRLSVACRRMHAVAADDSLWEALVRRGVCPTTQRQSDRAAFGASEKRRLDRVCASVEGFPHPVQRVGPLADLPPLPLPELPPKVCMGSGDGRHTWRWLYVACHRFVDTIRISNAMPDARPETAVKPHSDRRAYDGDSCALAHGETLEKSEQRQTRRVSWWSRLRALCCDTIESVRAQRGPCYTMHAIDAHAMVSVDGMRYGKLPALVTETLSASWPARPFALNAPRKDAAHDGTQTGASLSLKKTVLVLKVGDIDRKGRLCGFGLWAVCAPTDAVSDSGAASIEPRHLSLHQNGRARTDSDSASSADTSLGGDKDDDDLNRVVGWKWVEWAWGTWDSCGRLDGQGAMRSTGLVRHEGRFSRGKADGVGMRTVPAWCTHSGWHEIRIEGEWRSGKNHGRVTQTTSCGDVCVSLWSDGAIESIESAELQARAVRRTDGPRLTGLSIRGVAWRIESAPSILRTATESTKAIEGMVHTPFRQCFVAVPLDRNILDRYVDYIQQGHPCLSRHLADCIVRLGMRVRHQLPAPGLPHVTVGDRVKVRVSIDSLCHRPDDDDGGDDNVEDNVEDNDGDKGDVSPRKTPTTRPM